MPLVGERAFGGTEGTDRGPVAGPRNPVGRGFRPSGTGKELRGTPLPNLEDPAAPLTAPRDTPPPAGFAPIAAHWEPRRSFAGTYDAGWQASRAPYLPTDFDARFFQLAPHPLVAGRYLQGGELVDVRGATPNGTLQFQLPALRVHVDYRLGRNSQSRPAVLDTVIVEPDESRLVLVWRAALRCDKEVLKVEEVEPTVAEA